MDKENVNPSIEVPFTQEGQHLRKTNNKKAKDIAMSNEVSPKRRRAEELNNKSKTGSNKKGVSNNINEISNVNVSQESSATEPLSSQAILNHRLQKHSNTELYDPKQSQEERIELRKNYRDLHRYVKSKCNISNTSVLTF